MFPDWKEEFAPHILARGQKYCEDGKIRRIQHCGNTYIASVEGTEDYNINAVIAEVAKYTQANLILEPSIGSRTDLEGKYDGNFDGNVDKAINA